MKRYIIFLSVFVCTLFFAGAEVKIDHASIHRSGDSVYVDFTMTVPDRTVGSDYVQRITPVLKNQSDSVALDEIEIVGKRKQKLRRREEVLTGKTYEPVPYQTVNGGEVRYAVVLPYESWMSETPVELSLARECEGCCRVSPLPGIALCREVAVAPPYQPQVKPVPLIPSVAERLAEVEKVLFPMTAYEPYSEAMQVWREKGALKVFFPLDKSDLRRDYRDNGETLDKIVDILKQIYADDRSDVGKILIVGFASPEGPTLRNERLAGARQPLRGSQWRRGLGRIARHGRGQFVRLQGADARHHRQHPRPQSAGVAVASSRGWKTLCRDVEVGIYRAT